jgi:hypothetical protein
MALAGWIPARAADPDLLPSWKDGTVKRALLTFVRRVSQ